MTKQDKKFRRRNRNLEHKQLNKLKNMKDQWRKHIT